MDFNSLGGWMLARFARPHWQSRVFSLLIVGALVLLVGVVDWITSIRISLSIFYLVPVALAALWLGRGWGVVAALGSVCVRLVGDFLSHDSGFAPAWIIWNAIVSLAVFLVFVGILDALNSLYHQLEDRVADRTRALHESVEARKRVERELRDVGSRERAAIGRELHDDLCQHLVGTALAAKVLGERVADTVNAAEVQAIIGLLEEGVAKTRDLARGLLLASIDPAELANELEELAHKASNAGVACVFRREGMASVEDSATAAQLFRIAQEAVRNALRHAGPSRVEVLLRGEEQGLTLCVEDDGVGMPRDERRHQGMGLRIMAHRATVIGGHLSIDPVGARGTRVICRVASRTAAASVSRDG